MMSVQMLPTAVRLDQEFYLAGQQPDNLCGPYWIAMLLRAYGFAVDTEQVALLAGSILPVGTPVWLPPTAKPRQDYRLSLPQTQQVAQAGTAVVGLIEAASRASEGCFSLVPLRMVWSPERLETLLTLCQDNPNWEAVPLCNLHTRSLWGSHLLLGDVMNYLNGKEIAVPKADWDVGHFVTLAGIAKGRRSLILVRDTYPIFGWDGYHLQSSEAIAAALNRDDGHEGGVLLFVATKDKAEVERQAKERGFELAVWDNGTPTSDRA